MRRPRSGPTGGGRLLSMYVCGRPFIRGVVFPETKWWGPFGAWHGSLGHGDWVQGTRHKAQDLGGLGPP